MPTDAARSILDGIYAFAPNRETLGGTAYAIAMPAGLVLVDCPPWTPETQAALDCLGGVRWLFLTHRGAIAGVERWQAAYHCEVILQEQEAYLLPEVPRTSFVREIAFAENCCGIWTCGHSPGSACLYARSGDGGQVGILFTGRHLLPDPQGRLLPLRTAKTFHWPRQLRSTAALRDRFSRETLQIICPGANTGFLRGRGCVTDAWERLQDLDLAAMQHAKIGPLGGFP